MKGKRGREQGLRRQGLGTTLDKSVRRKSGRMRVHSKVIKLRSGHILSLLVSDASMGTSLSSHGV